MQSAFTDFAVGAGGGLLFGIVKAVFGSGVLGALAAPVLAGSVVKGNRGTALATVAGFTLFAGLGQGNNAQASTSNSEVM